MVNGYLYDLVVERFGYKHSIMIESINPTIYGNLPKNHINDGEQPASVKTTIFQHFYRGQKVNTQLW